VRRDLTIPPTFPKRELVAPGAIRRLARALDERFGPRDWWPAESPFEMMVGAVLTQNANWKNVERAIDNLRARRCLSWRRILALRPAELGRLIRPAGYFRVKAKRLRALCVWFDERCGGDVRRLARAPTPRLREELLAVHGVGRETADSILLYGFGRPVFVVDAYTRRVLSRHGLIAGDEPYDLIRESFERALPLVRAVKAYNELHAQIVTLAKDFCRAREQCAGCPLSSWQRARRRSTPR